MQEMRKECTEFESKRAERHRKRLERLNKLKNKNGSGNAIDDPVRPANRRFQSSSSPDLTSGGRYNGGGPRYIDDNPYSAGSLPPPPVGYGYQGR